MFCRSPISRSKSISFRQVDISQQIYIAKQADISLQIYNAKQADITYQIYTSQPVNASR